MIDMNYVTLDDLNDLFEYIDINRQNFPFGPASMMVAISIMSADRIRLESRPSTGFVAYPAYAVFCTIRSIIDLYNESKGEVNEKE